MIEAESIEIREKEKEKEKEKCERKGGGLKRISTHLAGSILAN
jgi:hypothetical protein